MSAPNPGTTSSQNAATIPQASSVPKLRFESAAPESLTVDVLVIAVQQGEESIEFGQAALGDTITEALAETASALGFTGKTESTLRLPAPSGVAARSVLLVGLGAISEQKLGPLERRNRLRRCAGVALRTLDSVGTAALAFPVQDEAESEAVAMGALLGAYRFTSYKTAAPSKQALEQISVHVDGGSTASADHVHTVATAVLATRDLVNQPPSDLYPQSFADQVIREAEADDLAGKVTVEVIDEVELAARGFGGLIGIGSGSIRPPRLVKVSYTPSVDAPLIALVGKGITFDSGGISLKPAAKMENMKSDMAGAAAAVHSLFAIARLGLPIRVTAWLALAENMPSGSSVRPADVLRIYGGTTVEVTNTDAEGRLVLADALVAAAEESPDFLVDIATLTGAQVAALGRRTSGIMGSEAAQARMSRAAETAGEPMWAMPIPEEVRAYFDSNTADMKNAGAPAAGMLAAAAFLRDFVDEHMEWAHLDIAGPAFNSESAYGFTGLGGTGVSVRTLVEFARSVVES
ncbi:leucyl aminopeptidase [Humidisolicoccus flavus]|uniref:leucyl aminopeptidase n=1 Tax=Humidisolicoccus flavus TaxID=3111414 RepID=UPI00324B8679